MGRVLIVDDEEDVRALIRTNLLVKGHEVLEASSGVDALDKAISNNLDLVILDVMMPGMDGFEVLDALRSTPETETLPVLMLTAKSSEEDRVKGLVKGAHDYLSKPFFTTELLLRIDRILNVKATADSLRQISMTDPVTGVYNRRYFELRLEQLCESTRNAETDLVAYVIDIQGMQDVARRHGWRPVDRVLAALGMSLKEEISGTEEAFWLGAGFVVLDNSISSANDARKRIEHFKRILTEITSANRKEVPLSLYFGYAFRDKHANADDFFNEIGQAAYKSGALTSPMEETRRSAEQSIEKAFGGKLTGLAPVAPTVEEREGRQKVRSERPKKISSGILQRELREITNIVSGSDRSSDSGQSKFDRHQEHSAVTNLPGGLEQLKMFLSTECQKASAGQFDLAIITIEIRGIDEAVAHSGKNAVDDTLGPITLEVASLAHEGETTFWTGQHLMFVTRDIGVREARQRIEVLSRAYTDRLAPHRTRIRLEPAGGYAYYDFEESVESLVERAMKSPHRGGPPITPLEARKASTKD